MVAFLELAYHILITQGANDAMDDQSLHDGRS